MLAGKAILIAGAMSLVAAATGLSPEQEILYQELGEELRCPTCQGLSVLDSDAMFSKQIQDKLKAKIAEGLNREDILIFFTERYGLWILREPPKEGISLLAWLLPAFVFLIIPIFLWRFFWSRQRITSSSVRTEEEIYQQMQQELAVLRK